VFIGTNTKYNRAEQTGLELNKIKQNTMPSVNTMLYGCPIFATAG
jgi:hypothetical protein